MCDNCKNCKGKGNFALAFKDNSVPVQAVFSKYGMGKMEPTLQNALTGTVAYGEPFLKEVSLAAAGASADQSNFTDEQNNQNLDLASQIFGILGTAANAGINIGKGIMDIKNQGKPGYTATNTQTQATGQPQVVYVQQPTQAAQPNSFGSTQLLLVLVAGAAFVAILFLIKGSKKGA